MKIIRDSIKETARLPESIWSRVRQLLLGKPVDPYDPSITHKMSLIALLAWVGLGADGLSSSAYGPAEAYATLVGHEGGDHTYLALLIGLATAITVFIISYSYSRIIEQFPGGGGGYLVASHLLGAHAGVVSGCALLVDYVLTITVSIASGGDAIFSLLPPGVMIPHTQIPLESLKMVLEFATIGLLLLMNLRGVKESVSMLVPVFMIFLVTHAFMIVGVFLKSAPHMVATAHKMQNQFHNDMKSMGPLLIASLFVKAYSMGAGTYTGIEAVSNGMSIMREPRVETGKRTMVFMATSLALTAGGLLFGYMLMNIQPDADGHRTLNTILADSFAGSWTLGKWPVGQWFVMIAIASEAVLLLVAAQAGFIDGPRVMSNMALDDWLPHKFAALSERLTMQNGILLMGGSAAILLAVTRGNIDMLVVMYSINVFVTFSLSQLGMMRFWIDERKKHSVHWKRHFLVHLIAFLLCFGILGLMIAEKLFDGAWLTIVITAAFIAVCILIRAHYLNLAGAVKKTDQIFANISKVTKTSTPPPEFDNSNVTAVLLVRSYNGLGIHSLLSIFRLFPNAFKNVVFISVGVVDSGLFKGAEQLQHLEETTKENLERYVQLAHSLGIPAKSIYKIGTDVVREASELCVEVSEDCPRATFFAGEVLFGQPHWWDKFLHNDVAFAIQRRIRFVGLSMVVLPMLVQQVTANPGVAGVMPTTAKAAPASSPEIEPQA